MITFNIQYFLSYRMLLNIAHNKYSVITVDRSYLWPRHTCVGGKPRTQNPHILENNNDNLLVILVNEITHDIFRRFTFSIVETWEPITMFLSSTQIC